MPKCTNVDWQDYKIAASFKGFRKWRLLCWVPYLSGSNVGLVLTIKTISKCERKFIYKWRLFRFDGQKEHNVTDWNEKSYIDNPKKKVTEECARFLVTYGQYNLQLQLDDKMEGNGNTGPKVLAVYSVLERDRIVPNIIQTIVALVIGASLTLLIQWIIS